MIKHFSAFYDYSPETYKDIIENGIIVLDTNVLLDLYRYDEKNSEILIKIIKKLQNRLMMPYWVGMEYSKNRTNVISQKINEPGHLKKKFAPQIKENLNKLKRIIDSERLYSPDKEKMFKQLSSATKDYADALSTIVDAFTNGVDEKYFEEDPILDFITQVYDGKINLHAQHKYEKDNLAKICEEGRIRFINKIPPGYEDNKKDGPSRYGDYFIWLEILAYCKANKKHCIFVSRDTKPDWIQKSKKDNDGPRYELIKDFKDETGDHSLLVYTTKFFIKKFAEILKIDDVENLVKQAEEIEKSASIESTVRFGTPTVAFSQLNTESAIQQLNEQIRATQVTWSKLNPSDALSHSIAQLQAAMAPLKNISLSTIGITGRLLDTDDYCPMHEQTVDLSLCSSCIHARHLDSERGMVRCAHQNHQEDEE